MPRFGLGIASGTPSPGGMVLWTRLTGSNLPGATTVRWEVADDESFTRVIARGTETAEAATAHTAHAEPAGLAPGRWYFYRFFALGDASPIGRTRTAPAPNEPATLRFALGSCQRFDMGHYAAWRQVAADAPDLVVFVGDYIYETATRPDPVRRMEGGAVRTLAEYRARYATHKSDPHLRAAHAAAPWLVVWDDHEVQNDYANLQSQDLDPAFAARRAAAYQSYWEHMPLPKSARPSGIDMRIYGRLDWGALARIHLLDDRQYRDPQACPRPGRGGSNVVPLADCPAFTDPRRSLLGAAQERWLADGWSTERPWNLVAQQTLMARFDWQDPSVGQSYWSDGWDGYAASRDRLLDVVAQRRVPGVVVLGGDVHSHYVADLKLNFADPRSMAVATEFCGTSISSHSSVPQSRLDAARAFNPHLRYARSDRRGYVAFEIDSRSLGARLQAVERPADPQSPVETLARFAVDPKRPGAEPA